MSERKEIKQKLLPLLPYGSYSKIKRAIFLKNGRELSVEQIRTVLNPTKDKWDIDVIDEAKKIAIPIQEQINDLQESLS